MPPIKLLFDADTFAYRCGYAAEKVVDGKRKDLGDYQAVNNLVKSIESTVDFFQKSFGKIETHFYLSSSFSFRSDASYIKKYKGNRDPQDKPIHLGLLQQILIDRYDAEKWAGLEADDILGILGWDAYKHEKDAVLVTNDKDLFQIPGAHFDWTAKSPSVVYIDEKDADYYWAIQMLTGDPVDNIEGIPYVGKKKAQELLEYGKSKEEYEKRIKELYEYYFNLDKKIRGREYTYKEYCFDVLKMTPLDIYHEVEALITILRELEEQE